MQQADRPVTLHVAKLMRVIVRDQKHAVFLPLEGLLRALFAGPNRRQSASFDDVHDLVERELERRQRFAGRNLSYPRRRHALLPDQLNESGIALTGVPPAKL
jgi:hypothetical protein